MLPAAVKPPKFVVNGRTANTCAPNCGGVILTTAVVPETAVKKLTGAIVAAAVTVFGCGCCSL
jgi:hypothetical protein